jgi:hypothetical protein
MANQKEFFKLTIQSCLKVMYFKMALKNLVRQMKWVSVAEIVTERLSLWT